MGENCRAGGAVTVHFLKDTTEKPKEEKSRKVGETRNLQKDPPPINSLHLCPTLSDDKAGVALA